MCIIHNFPESCCTPSRICTFLELLFHYSQGPMSSFSSGSTGSAPQTWTRPSVAVRRQGSVGWKARDWTTPFPMGSFNVTDPWGARKTQRLVRDLLFAIEPLPQSSALLFVVAYYNVNYECTVKIYIGLYFFLFSFFYFPGFLPPLGPSSTRDRPQSSSARGCLYWRGSSPSCSSCSDDPCTCSQRYEGERGRARDMLMTNKKRERERLC